MKNEIFRYLEYSIFLRNYVIIPGFGGFIVDTETVYPGVKIEPEKFRIVFNPELNHDDGILVTYIAKDGKTPYNVASQKLKDFVKDLKHELQSGVVVSFGLGSLYLNNEGNISFSVDKSVVHPGFYGLMPVELQYLTDIKSTSKKESRNVFLRNMVGGAAAIAAAVFLFVTPSINISDKGNGQEAGFIHSLANSLVEENSVDSCLQVEKSNLLIDKVNPVRTYYVVVGGEDSQSRADRLLEKVQSAGFKNANIVESAGRFRIYVASFTDKVEGESFLETFRAGNPKYGTAWLYSKQSN